MAAKTFTPKEIAEDLGTDGKTFRKYLRSVTPKDEQPGKGNRWALTSKQVRDAKKGFKAWDETRRAPKAEDEAPADNEVDEDPEVPTDEVEADAVEADEVEGIEEIDLDLDEVDLELDDNED